MFLTIVHTEKISLDRKHTSSFPSDDNFFNYPHATKWPLFGLPKGRQ
jgi:hypothetical protein